MYCPKCGTNNQNKAKFCKECGEPLNAEQVLSLRREPWPIKVVLLTTSVAIAIGGLFIYLQLNTHDGRENVTVVEHTYDTQAGTDWDTGLGLSVSVSPTTQKNKATVVVQRSILEQIDEAFIASEAIYDVAVEQGSSTTYSPPVTLAFSIPDDVDPNSMVVLEKTENGWVPAENEIGIPGGSITEDGKQIVVAREHLSKYALSRWMYKHIFKHLNKLPQAPPPDPILKVKQTGDEYLGYPITQVEVSSPYAVKQAIPVFGEVGVGGMWYRIKLESEQAKLMGGLTSLSPGEKHNLKISFPNPEEHARLCLSTRGTLLRAAWDWTERMGIPHHKVDKIITGVEKLLETYEHLPEGSRSFKDLVWLAKELLIEVIWEFVGWQAQYLGNMVPVSIDIGTYISARTDSRSDPCIDVSATATTHTSTTVSPVPPENPILTPSSGHDKEVSALPTGTVENKEPDRGHGYSEIQKSISEANAFTDPITLELAGGDDPQVFEEYRTQTLGALPAPAHPGWVSASGKGWLDFLVSKGYAEEKTVMAQAYLGSEIESRFLFYNEKIKPYIYNGKEETGSYFDLHIADRKVQRIESTSEYELLGEKYNDVNFRYTLIEVLPGLPDVENQFKGLAVFYWDQSRGVWLLWDVNLDDKGIYEYDDLLD